MNLPRVREFAPGSIAKGAAVVERRAAPVVRARPRWLSGEFSAYATLLLAINLGLFVRLVLVMQGDGFPLNDGGMFYAMIDDLKAANYRLPEFTSYNGGAIPFAYPPLAFYGAAILSDVAGISTIDILRFWPLAFSVLTIPAVYLLARAVLPS